MTKSIERREAQDGTWETVVVDENGNGGSQPVGTTLLTPVLYDSVRVALVMVDEATTLPYIYDNGPQDDGVGATMTAENNGALEVDGVTPELGDRVVVCDLVYEGDLSFGVYIVTDLGDVDAPWVLTRATDCNTAAALGVYWVVPISEGALYAGGRASVDAVDTNQPIGGAGFVGFSVTSVGSIAAGRNSIVTVPSGADAVVLGSSAFAATDGIAIGTSAAAANHAVALLGDATGASAVAIGELTIASETDAVAIGHEAAGTDTRALAIGKAAQATAVDATAIGSGTQASQTGVTVIDGPQGVQAAATGGKVGFYGTAPIAKQTGVAVDAAAIHAALVNLGLIAS